MSFRITGKVRKSQVQPLDLGRPLAFHVVCFQEQAKAAKDSGRLCRFAWVSRNHELPNRKLVEGPKTNWPSVGPELRGGQCAWEVFVLVSGHGPCLDLICKARGGSHLMQNGHAYHRLQHVVCTNSELTWLVIEVESLLRKSSTQVGQYR